MPSPRFQSAAAKSSSEEDDEQETCFGYSCSRIFRRMLRSAIPRLSFWRTTRENLRRLISDSQPLTATFHGEHTQDSATFRASARTRLVVAQPYDRLLSQPWSDRLSRPLPSEQLWEAVDARRPSRGSQDIWLRAQRQHQDALEQLDVQYCAIFSSWAGHEQHHEIEIDHARRYVPLGMTTYNYGGTLFVYQAFKLVLSPSDEPTEPPDYSDDISPPAYSDTETVDDLFQPD
ncbi:hypothetical protein ED733_007379 [Metarhizium rileyi]|uniref:Uncharacterized protein n=1 Tax=Metarhizium rileyi (strain RCEF 4871) TaxID=1649241 RepID=A0A5C6GKI9_METRR|nr:hypothetical protein ED733_007379 [Metarhizium rileyi]